MIFRIALDLEITIITAGKISGGILLGKGSTYFVELSNALFSQLNVNSLSNQDRS